MVAKMRAVHLKEPSREDPASGVEVAEVDRPQPGQGKVLVNIILRPVNPADIFSLQGVYPGFQPKAYPAVPGLEGVGVIEENGPGAGKYKPGQRVVGAPWPVQSGNGTWQQYMAVSEERLGHGEGKRVGRQNAKGQCRVSLQAAVSMCFTVREAECGLAKFPVPDDVTDEAAAQFFVNPVAVYGMLHVLNVPKGEYLLQTAGGSVLGRMTIELAKHYGIKTISVVRGDHHVQELKDLGADEVIVSETGEDLADHVKKITDGKGAYGATECVGGDLFAHVAASVRKGGHVLIYGAMAGMEAKFFIPDLLFRDVTLRGFWIATWMHSMSTEERGKVVADIMQLLEKKVITPHSGDRFSFDQVKEAIAKATASGRGGKVLLEG
ncbi:hypothetical protein N2152v2_002945 [Parachlorella kessleri]